MENPSTFNYVRMFRTRHALTQEDLAQLVGQRSPAVISKIESGERVPSLRVALALQVLFRQVPQHLFLEFYEHVEEEVMRAAARQYRAVEGKSDRRSNAKRELFEGIVREASAEAA